MLERNGRAKKTNENRQGGRCARQEPVGLKDKKGICEQHGDDSKDEGGSGPGFVPTKSAIAGDRKELEKRSESHDSFGPNRELERERDRTEKIKADGEQTYDDANDLENKRFRQEGRPRSPGKPHADCGNHSQALLNNDVAGKRSGEAKACGDECSVEPFAFEALAKACPAEPAQRGVKPSPAVPFGDGDRTHAHSQGSCGCEKEEKKQPAEKSRQSGYPSLRGAKVDGSVDAQRRCLILWHQGEPLERVFIEPSGLTEPGAALPRLQRRHQCAAWHAIDRSPVVAE